MTAAPTHKPARPSAAPAWTRPHLLALEGLTPDELRAVLTAARDWGDDASRLDTLRGHTIGNLFFEDSTRTRLSFTAAARRLGAEVLDLSSGGSSVSKGETVIDTAANVLAMGVCAMVVRHKSSGAPAMVAHAIDRLTAAGLGATDASGTGCSVINAGDGKHEHPTQGLLDIYTLAEAKGRLADFNLRGLRIAIVGDVISSRVARSDIAGMTALGAEVVCVGPPWMAPRSLANLGVGGCSICHNLDEVLGTVDAVQMLRIQFERHDEGTAGKAESGKGGGSVSSTREYAECYGLSEARAARMKPGAVVMHPGPINRGLELAGPVADGERSLVLRQVENGVRVRTAVLGLCIGARAARR